MYVTRKRGGGGGSTNTLITTECPGIGCGQQDAQLATPMEDKAEAYRTGTWARSATDQLQPSH